MLAHAAYFEALSSISDDTSPEWKATTAGLVVLRLVDTWLDLGAQIVTTDVTGLCAVRDAVAAVSTGDPVRSILTSLVDAVEQAETATIHAVGPSMLAYGQALHYAGQWHLAQDVFLTLRERAEVADDQVLAVEAGLQAAKNLRLLSNFDAAEQTYLSAIRGAEALGDVASCIRARIGRAQIVASRGNLPAADEFMEAIATEAHEARLPELYGQALHNRASLAFLQKNYTAVVRLAYQALEYTTNSVHRDRILADIAVAFAQLGHLAASRDANLLLASTAQEQELRWHALLNLMYVAILEGHEVAFEQYRSTLEQTPLPARIEAYYRVDAAMGLWKFGRPDRATVELARARHIAGQYGFHQLAFEIDALEAEAVPTAAPDTPAAWSAEIDAIAAAIGEWRRFQDTATTKIAEGAI